MWQVINSIQFKLVESAFNCSNRAIANAVISTFRFYRCSKCNYPMCGEDCENGDLHSKYECAAFQNAGYKVDSKESNEKVGKLIGDSDEVSGEIFKDVQSYRNYIEAGGFSPYCFISTLRCIMMKGK